MTIPPVPDPYAEIRRLEREVQELTVERERLAERLLVDTALLRGACGQLRSALFVLTNPDVFPELDTLSAEADRG